jgi:hypothetical protein
LPDANATVADTAVTNAVKPATLVSANPVREIAFVIAATILSIAASEWGLRLKRIVNREAAAPANKR